MAEKKQSSEEKLKNEARRKKSAALRAAREKEVRRQMLTIGGGAAAVILIILLAVLLLKKPSATSTEDKTADLTQTDVMAESAEAAQETAAVESAEAAQETAAVESAEAAQETAGTGDGSSLDTAEPVVIEGQSLSAAETVSGESASATTVEAAAEGQADGADSDRPADLPDIDPDSWQYVLANADHPIGDYTPEVVEVENDQYVDYRIYDAITSFISDCRDAGNSVYLSSAYRSYETQDYLFQRKVEQYGSEEEAARIVLPPGTSEHQTGLAADITEEYYEVKNRELENTAMYQWMAAHCQDYGFIVRYPDGKEDITDIIYEPWHFRYVGVEAATYIMEHGITLEEFLAYYE